MDHEANFAEVKQAKKVKPQVTRSCIYVTTRKIEKIFRQGSLHEM